MRQRRLDVLRIATALVILMALSVSPGHAQIGFGGQASFGGDADFGLGARLLVDFTSLSEDVSEATEGRLGGLQFVGSFDYFFPGEGGKVTVNGQPRLEAGRDYWEVNGNLIYSIAVEDLTAFNPYGGGGLNVARDSRNVTVTDALGNRGTATVSNTDVGLNLVAGAAFGDPAESSVSPFVELKVELGGGDQFMASAGITF